MHPALFSILVMLGQGPAEAAEIRDRIRVRGGRDELPSIPAFYRHLKSGIDAGWIQVDGSAVGPGGRGRPRQIYALTGSGEKALRRRALWLRKLMGLALEGGGR